MASPIDRVWSEGHKAGKHGSPVTANPYKAGMAEQAWLKGWHIGAQARDAKNA
jgi:ribosome modulation factor